MAYVRSFDRDELRAAIRRATPFPNVCIDYFLEERFARDVAVSFPTYLDATRIGRNFKAVNEGGKVQVTDPARFPERIARLNAELASPEFLQLLSYLFDIPNLIADEELVGGGIHETGPHGHLDVHVDFNYIAKRKLFRRLNLLLYFNEDWQQEWGGELELWDAQVKVRHHLVPPVFNRCVIFETSDISYHGVRAVTCPDSICRKSFAAYYYTREPPPRWSGRNHSTIFRARPEETLKRVLYMPAEHAVRGVSRLMRRGKSLLRRIRLGSDAG